jgi:hypothetical protein
MISQEVSISERITEAKSVSLMGGCQMDGLRGICSPFI